jgi:hypothetical protein
MNPKIEMMSGITPIPRRIRVAMIRPTLPGLLLSRIVIMPPIIRTKATVSADFLVFLRNSYSMKMEAEESMP